LYEKTVYARLHVPPFARPSRQVGAGREGAGREPQRCAAGYSDSSFEQIRSIDMAHEISAIEYAGQAVVHLAVASEMRGSATGKSNLKIAIVELEKALKAAKVAQRQANKPNK